MSYPRGRKLRIEQSWDKLMEVSYEAGSSRTIFRYRADLLAPLLISQERQLCILSESPKGIHQSK